MAAWESGGRRVSRLLLVNKPEAGEMVGGGKVGNPGMLSIHAAMAETALLSIIFLASGGILMVDCNVFMRS